MRDNMFSIHTRKYAPTAAVKARKNPLYHTQNKIQNHLKTMWHLRHSKSGVKDKH